MVSVDDDQPATEFGNLDRAYVAGSGMMSLEDLENLAEVKRRQIVLRCVQSMNAHSMHRTEHGLSPVPHHRSCTIRILFRRDWDECFHFGLPSPSFSVGSS